MEGTGAAVALRAQEGTVAARPGKDAALLGARRAAADGARVDPGAGEVEVLTASNRG